jgi:Ca2+-binding RTX toxin-like protein
MTKFMTIDASASETGVDYAAYLASYFAEQGTAPADPFGGDVQYYGSTFYAMMGGYYDGTQVGIRHPDSTNQNQILIEGANMQYDGIVDVHGSYSGSADSVTFGYYNEDTLSVENGSQRSTLIGVLQELKISGLDIFEKVGAGTDADNAFYQLMKALENGNSTTIAEGNTLTNGELAIQKLYEMFNAKAQYFIGSEGDDTYVGTKFADKIDGGAGIDTLTGGKGKDVFIFDLGDSSVSLEDADTILGFNTKQDRIDLRSIDTNVEKDGDQAFKFLGTGDFTGKPGQVNYERVDGQTLVHLDIDGNSEADMTFILQGNHKLQADDFLL